MSSSIDMIKVPTESKSEGAVPEEISPVTDPTVSVILPVYNREKLVEQAVESILSQTFQDFELLIIDDGSTDGTWEILSSWNNHPRVRLIRTDHGGPTSALNQGLRRARGKFIARQDSDDISEPERLERQVAFLNTHLDVGVVGTWAVLIDEEGNENGTYDSFVSERQIRSQLFYGENPVLHGSVLFRRTCLEELGGYDKAWPYAQDYELWIRYSRKYRLANLPERLYRWRSWHGQVSNRNYVEQKGAARSIQEACREQIFRFLEDEAEPAGAFPFRDRREILQLLRYLIVQGLKRKEWQIAKRLAAGWIRLDPWSLRARFQFLNASFQGWARPKVKKILGIA